MRSLLIRFVRLVRHQYGAISVMFAIMFPLVIMFYSVAFDGANLQSSRARLADSINQGVLAIAVIDNRNATVADKAANITLLHHYISYYLPDAAIADKDLNVTSVENYSTSGSKKLNSVDYAASGKINVRPLIGAHESVGFDSAVGLRADNGAGVVRKKIEEVQHPTDYAFVLDFSSSMLSQSAERGLTRIELLRRVVTDFMREILNNNDANNTVGIIPFGTGVPVILPGKNIAGGNNFGCSTVGKLNPKYQNVDFDFWYNKMFARSSTISTPSETKQSYNYDNLLYDYYRNIIGPATGLNINDMVNKGWCVKNKTSDKDRALYSCDADPRSSLFNNYAEFKDSRASAHELMFLANKHYGVINIETLDYDGLINDGYMFSEESVITFNYTVGSENYRPFIYDCISAFYFVKDSDAVNKLKDKTLKPASYLIELTSNQDVVAEFSNMTIATKTDTGVPTNVTSGLLRSLPVIAKGTNARKAIIVISDGLDSGSTTGGPYALTDRLFKKYNLCDRIREGLLQYPKGTSTEKADIFFIFTVDSSQAPKALDLWRNHCAGSNVYLATNYQEITNVLMGIARKASIKFINKNEPE